MSALRKVLVVDDDPVVGRSFDRVLTGRGYVVVTAENAVQALERMREQEYDVVFTDIKMPGMSGIELAEEVKARRPWTPVVIVTGYGSTANEERARAAGVAGFLNKPLSPDMIEQSAAQALMAVPEARAADAVPSADTPVTPETGAGRLRSVALFLAAPFVGLLYAVLLPLVGAAMLLWVGGKALVRASDARGVAGSARKTGMMLVTPFIGLAYAVFLPVIGIGMLLWAGTTALMDKSGTQ